MSGAAAHDVAVVIITYRRPGLLSRAIAAVSAQLDEVDRNSYVLVVDNDPGRSADDVVASFRDQRVRYHHEPRPGIPAARNAAFDVAHGARLVVFIDDDETPEPGWLCALVEAWDEWGCDAVAGPNVRSLDGTEDSWVRASGFFEPRTRPHGAVIPGAPTSNLLLDMESVRRLALRFDERFATTGGSDTLFTAQLTRRGGVIRWCQHAATTEPTPPARATRQWVLSRERRAGNTWSRVHLTLAEHRLASIRTGAWLAAIGGKLLATGAVRRALAAFSGSLRQQARGERQLANGCGVLLGLMGGRIEEYRRQEVS